MNSSIKPVTVKDFKKMLNALIRQGDIKESDEVWISSDGEGNDHSPFVTIRGQYNLDVEEGKITLYPIH